MRARRIKTVIAMTFAVLVAGPIAPASAGVTVTGSGSTWSQIAIEQWRADISRYGVKINYSGVGSSAGRTNFINGTTDFAVSEIPFEKNEVDALKQKKKAFVYLPIVAGGTSMMYNLKDASGQAVRDLRLSSNTIAKIFTRKITKWNDPQIASDNAGRSLPARDIVPVVRSDGSGTSAQFTTYLLKREKATWCAFAQSAGVNPCSYTSNWPQADGFVYQSGSDGVANYVHSEGTGQGAITYVETGYALQRRRPVVAVKNQSGNFALPTSKNVSIALTKAELNADRTQRLDAVYTNPDPNTYPISSYSYMIAPTTGFPKDKGNVLGQFMLYFACTGQRKADQLGYAPLPANLVKIVFEAEQQVPGAPTPPALSECDNPTIQGGAGSASNDTGDDLSSAGGGDGVVSPTDPPGVSGGGGGGGGGGPAGTSGGGGGSSGSAGGTGGTAGGGTGTTGGAGAEAGYVGGTTGGGANNVALPGLKLNSSAPSWLPLAFAGLLIAIVVFIPPAFALFGKRSARRGQGS